MKSVRLFLVLGTVVVGLACLILLSESRPPKPGIPSTDPDIGMADDLVVGEPFVFRNLAIFPVSSKMPRSDDRFITLDEGLKAGTVEIFEKGSGRGNQSANQLSSTTADLFANPSVDDPGQNQVNTSAAVQETIPANEVNELMVVNRSEKPLYLMPGEIVIGGSQDRTIAQELVIAPDKSPVSIGVFCVEHGRWGGRDEQQYARLLSAQAATNEPTTNRYFEANLSSLVSETTEVANGGKFIGIIGSLNRPARIAVQRDDDQQKVWAEVATQNTIGGVQAQSGTFAANYSESESLKRLEPCLEALHEPIDQAENILGVIVAVNGKVESMDVFESTPLFRKLWPKLLKSYALDASNAEADQSVKKLATRDDALAFVKEVAQSRAMRAETAGDLAVLHGESDRVLLFSAHERRRQDMDEPSAVGSGGYGKVELGGVFAGEILGGAIHSSGFAK